MTPPLLHPSGQHRESKLLELNLQLICMKMALFVQFAPIFQPFTVQKGQ